MTDTPDVRSLLTDAFGRVDEVVRDALDGASAAALAYRPDPESNSAAWLIWHLARVQDDHIAGVAGTDQVWDAGWVDRCGLPFDPEETGYGHEPDDVAAVRLSADLLREYHAKVHQRTLDYLARVDGAELARVVDERWDPPVTAEVRLVSVISDCLQHAGQAAYVLGVFARNPST